ncbi:hypothetical protein [Escherichia coli]|uniref:hypothetical protein n=1 Tax=Escherichia coli TaxID=562 RepID=UPI0032E4059C
MANRVTSPARWDDVEIGDTVEIRSTRHVIHRGLVDARTQDGTVVWVIAPADGRRMFHVADGYALAGPAPAS